MREKHFYNNLKYELFKKLDQWKKFKPILGKIEDFFKLLKQGLNMKPIHKYTPKSIAGYDDENKCAYLEYPDERRVMSKKNRLPEIIIFAGPNAVGKLL